MKKDNEKSQSPGKKSDFDQEREKLLEIFEIAEDSEQKLVEGLIDEAAFLRSENIKLRAAMAETGMVRIHPENPGIQKTTEAAKQYGRNVNTYATVIKTLNGILNKSVTEEDDGFVRWLQERDKARKERDK